MKLENYIPIIKETYLGINFIERFSDFMKIERDFDNRMTKIDKKKILNILDEIGYTFKVFTPGRDFYFQEEFGQLKFVFSFNCNGGIIVSYISIYIDDEKLNYQKNLAFVYKHLINDMETQINVASFLFTNYEEFNIIITDILYIYKDFREEFIKNIKELEL